MGEWNTELDMQPVAPAVEAELERLQRAPGSYLPVTVVEPLMKMRDRSEEELRRLIVNAAVALAVKLNGDVTPKKVLATAMDAAPARSWEEKIKPEIKRLWAQAA
jgi:hypothetical protein